MRASILFGETLRAAPAEADSISYQLLLRAGYLRPLGAGSFSFLPPGRRSLQKIQHIITEELETIAGQEVSLPLLLPVELWQSRCAPGEELLRFRDRRGRELLLPPSRKEAAAHLAAAVLRSYRQLPQLIFQFNPTFCDEERLRGGLLHAREFLLAEAFSFDGDESSFRQQYARLNGAFARIAARLKLPLKTVEGESEDLERRPAHALVYVSPAGERVIAACPYCGYAALRESTRFRKEALDNGPLKPLEKVATPGAASIEELSKFLGIEKRQTAKAVFYRADFGANEPPRLVLALVRGDMEANETRIRSLAGAAALRPAEVEEIAAAGCAPGFASPIGLRRGNVLVFVDDLVANSANLVTGANETDYHFLNSNCGRDYQPDRVGDIALVYENAPCGRCSQPLALQNAVEVGSMQASGAGAAFTAEYLDEQGKSRPVVMGFYRIDLGRCLACLAEAHHDDYGLRLPISVAPYQAMLLLLKGEPQSVETAEKLYQQLRQAGVEVLYDDRDASPGVKFNDADLRGIPLRITVSDRSLQSGGVEFKRRDQKEKTIIAVEALVAKVCDEIRALAEFPEAPVERSAWRDDMNY